jgi:hypothetical protein
MDRPVLSTIENALTSDDSVQHFSPWNFLVEYVQSKVWHEECRLQKCDAMWLLQEPKIQGNMPSPSSECKDVAT